MAGWAEAAQQGSSLPLSDKLDSALCLQLHAHVFWSSCHPGSCRQPLTFVVVAAGVLVAFSLPELRRFYLLP